MGLHLLRPNHIEEALSLQKEHNGIYLAGGTILMVEHYEGKYNADTLIDLSRIKELQGIVERKEELIIGGSVTFTEIEEHNGCRESATCLWQAAREVGGPQIRNRATIGGNLCSGSPAADAATPLIALGASVKLRSIDGERMLPVEAFFLDVRKTALNPGEVLVAIHIPRYGAVSQFYKVGKRKSLAVSCINMALSYYKTEVGQVENIRVAVGSCAPTPIFCKRTSKKIYHFINHHVLDLEDIYHELMQEIAPIDDKWGTANYRRMVCKNLLEKYLLEMRGIQ